MYGLFKAISLSHKKAPLEIREQIALNEEESKNLMLKIKEVFDIEELLVISTCNRTEVYYCSENDYNLELIKLLASQKVIQSTEIVSYFDMISDHQEAVKYLFEVSFGLHSQVIGDLQITSQIKQAYQISADLQMAGAFLHRLLHTIFFTNKRIVQETSYRDGAATTSYAAADMMESFLGSLREPKILVIGVGEIGQDVCRTLADKGYKNITIINRTRAKAEELAHSLGFEVADYETLNEKIEESNIIISSIRCETPLLTPATFEHKAPFAIKYLIDLSVPRSIEPSVENIAGIVLYNLDEIQARANAGMQRRLEAIPHVKNIIQDAIAEFNHWSQEMIVSPTIQKLKNALEQIRKEEMARYMKNMTAEELEKIDKITANIMQKVIKLPVLQLKAACKRGEADSMIDVLNELFDLEKQSV
jgi:glutamyl-tRNA reductase